MINILALALLVSSLAAAGVWSPPPASKPTADPHLVREGHRLIVVEYERQVPLETPQPTIGTHNVIEEAKDRFQEASTLLPDIVQGVSMPESPAVEKPAHSAKDLICDAYGSCKERISGAFHKGREKISRKASDIEEIGKEVIEKTKEKGSHIKESAKDAGKRTMEGASKIEESAKDAVKNKMEGTLDAIKSTVEGAKDSAKSAVADISKAEEDVVGNISQRAEEVGNLLHQNLTDIVNRAKDVAFDAAKYVGVTGAVRTIASIAHLLAFAVAYGTCVWVTFVSSHVLATALPRQQFGIVQSKLYPVYFRVLSYAIGIACLGHFLSKKRANGLETVQGYNLMVALGLVLVNMFYLEPKATRVMFERLKMEKEEGRGRDISDGLGGGEPVMTTSTTTTAAASPQSATTIGMRRTTMVVDQEAVKSRVVKMSKKLKKFNTYSSFLNILTLMSLSWHVVHLGQELQMSC